LLFFLYLIISFNKTLILKAIIKWGLLVFFQIIISLIVILPFLSSQYEYSSTVFSTKTLWQDSMGFVLSTSSSPINSFRLKIGEWNFMENSIKWMPDIYVFLFSTLSFVFSIIIFYFLSVRKNKIRDNSIFYMFLFSYFVLLFLSFRLTTPFDYMNLFFYKELTLWIFRSSDKIAVFIPFFTIFLFIYALNKINLWRKWIIIIYLIVFLSISFILSWWIVKQYLYKNNNYSNIVKIPEEYYDIKKYINSDNNINSVLSIPYSVVNSLNWSNYQKWWYLWHDILHLLYNKNYISANSYDHIIIENKQSLKRFSDSSEKLENLIQIIENFWWRYIINHKDVENRYLWLTTENLNKLENSNIIKLLEKNDYFDLYEVNKNYINPLINWTDLNFKKINPTKYKIKIHLDWEKELSFLQSHNFKWNLYLNKDEFNCEITWIYKNSWNSIKECKHFETFFEWEELSYLYRKPIFEKSHKLVNDYANWWSISKEKIVNYVNNYYSEELKKEWYPKKLYNWNIDYKYYIVNKDWSIDVELTLYFKPQSYFYLGLLITGIIFLLLILWLIIDTMKNKKDKLLENKK
jgi:hypothetical protein